MQTLRCPYGFRTVETKLDIHDVHVYLKGVLITMGIPISFGTFLLCFSVQILGDEITDGLRISEIIALFYFS